MRKFLSSDKWVLVGLSVIILAVFYQSYYGRAAIWKSDTKNCKVSTVPAQLASIQRDQDLADFYGTSAAFRRKQGDRFAAQQSDRFQQRALIRIQQAKVRAAKPCDQRFPKPGLL